MAPSFCLGGGPVNAAEGGTDLLNLIPDTVKLDVKESAYVETNNAYPYISEQVNALVKSSVMQSLMTQDAEFDSVNADCGFVYYGGDFYSCTIGVSAEGNYIRKDVKVEYANTSNANAASKAAVQAKFDAVMSEMQIDKIVPKGDYMVFYHMYTADTATTVIAADNEKAKDNAERVVKQILNDNSYEIYVTDATMYGTGSGYLPSKTTSVMIFKNGEFYGALKALDLYSYYDGETVSMTEVAKSDKVYTEMASKLADKGHKTILGAYELKLNNGKGRYSLSFDVDKKYNGKAVVILHKIAEGTFEELYSVVENGSVKIETTSLSPFMIAVNDTVGETNGMGASVGSNTNNSSNNNNATVAKPASTKPGTSAPNTGVATEGDGSHAASAVLGSVIFSMIGCAVAGILTAKKIIARKKEQEA